MLSTGVVVSGLLLRSHARIKAASPLYLEEWERDQLQTLVQSVLDDRRDNLESIAS